MYYLVRRPKTGENITFSPRRPFLRSFSHCRATINTYRHSLSARILLGQLGLSLFCVVLGVAFALLHVVRQQDALGRGAKIRSKNIVRSSPFCLFLLCVGV